MDASLFEKERTIDVGTKIRKSSGRFVAAKTVKMQGTMDAKQAEVITAREGVRFDRELWI